MKTEEYERPSCMFARYNSIFSFRHDKRKPKRKRVHVPHSKRPKEFVDHRNSKERQRVGEMATAFDALMSVLPKSDDNVKPARIDVLRGAIDYIRELENKLVSDVNDRLIHFRETGVEMCPDIWTGSSVEEIPGNINVIQEGKTMPYSDSYVDYLGASIMKNESESCATGSPGYEFPIEAEPMLNNSMPMLEPSRAIFEYPHTREEQTVYEYEAVRGNSQERYSHRDMMYKSRVCTYSDIHVNSSIVETRKRLVDITNTHYDTRAYHPCTYEISKAMGFDLHVNTPHPSQWVGTAFHDVTIVPAPRVEDNNMGFYNIF